jgi:hypothetical protein
MSLSQIDVNLVILIFSIILVNLFYPSYLGIIAPLFIAITLFYSTDNMILSMFSILPQNINDFIVKYKTYLIIGFLTISAYYTMKMFQSNKEFDDKIIVLDMSDISDFSLPDTSSSFIKNNSNDMSTFDINKR